MVRWKPRPDLRAINASVATILLVVSQMVGPSSAFALGPICQVKSDHWWAQAASGYPATGTRLFTTTPTQWSVDQPSGSTMLEAAFLVDNNDAGQGVEGGYFSGLWPYSGLWYNGLLPYYSVDNGLTAHGHTSTYLAVGTGINLDVINGGHAVVGGQRMDFTRTVPNAQNWGQGEIKKSSNTWLGNGSDNHFTAYWTPDNGTNWYLWGWHNDCANSPYWINALGGSGYANGGY